MVGDGDVDRTHSGYGRRRRKNGKRARRKQEIEKKQKIETKSLNRFLPIIVFFKINNGRIFYLGNSVHGPFGRI